MIDSAQHSGSIKDMCPGCGQQIEAEYDASQETYVFIQHVHPKRADLPVDNEQRWCEFSLRPIST